MFARGKHAATVMLTTTVIDRIRSLSVFARGERRNEALAAGDDDDP